MKHERSKSRSARSRLSSCLLLSAVMLCATALMITWGVTTVLDQAQQIYGAPSRTLEVPQKIYLATKLLLQEQHLRQPRSASHKSFPFEIQVGESPAAIANRLQANDLIRDAGALVDYLVYSGLDTRLQAGQYQLSPRMTAVEIAHRLQDATPHEVTFVVFAGWRMEEIAAALPTSGLEFSPEAFLHVARTPSIGFAPDLTGISIPPGTSLEGYLFPDSYRLPRNVSVDGFIRILLENFANKVSESMLQGYTEEGMSLHQAVTLASIVEREAVVDDEMPVIASVFLNRLKTGMKLDADPTVQYAIGFNRQQNTWWTNPLSLKDLAYNSPYNTYQNTGLPPGPIANPGLLALQAVAFPAQTPYYYFRAACDGSGRHSFSETFEGHQQNACTP